MQAEQAQERARAALADRGLRATRQRVLVLAEVMRERNDATAQDVYRRLRDQGAGVGLATVYRTLGALAEARLVDTLSHHPGELCYRYCGEGHHHHLVCSGCHRVIEVADCDLDEWVGRVTAGHGFVPTAHHVEVTGLCVACAA